LKVKAYGNLRRYHVKTKVCSKTDTVRVRVTLEVPKKLIPLGEKEPAKALAALIVAALWEYRISIVRINPRDAKKLVEEV
jgi:hypothetical protein